MLFVNMVAPRKSNIYVFGLDELIHDFSIPGKRNNSFLNARLWWNILFLQGQLRRAEGCTSGCKAMTGERGAASVED